MDQDKERERIRDVVDVSHHGKLDRAMYPTKNDFKNWLVHLLIGFVISIVLSSWLVWWLLMIVVFIVSLCIELYQYFFMDNKELKLLDRILDICSYQLGVILTVIVRLLCIT